MHTDPNSSDISYSQNRGYGYFISEFDSAGKPLLTPDGRTCYDIDAYNHVNNAVYVTWCDYVAWHHSAALGLPIERCLKIDRGMAVIRTLITYVKPAFRNDALTIATWLLPSESRLCVRRRFQITRTEDGDTLARAEVEYACIEISTGKPARPPGKC